MAYRKLVLIGFLSFALHARSLFCQEHDKGCTTPSTITVWVHGTYDILKTGIMPLKKWHTSPPGIKLATKLPEDYNLRQFAELLSTEDPEHFSLKHFYTFGWSGKLSLQERKKASKNLSLVVKHLVKRYKEKHGHAPCLRIIAHSHGGNVVLYMAETQDAPFAVDELVLIATPVQEKTSHLIQSPMFKKIYSIYSSFDVLQIADPQILHKETLEEQIKTITTPSKIFSERVFPAQDNLVQALIRYKLRFPTHIDFVRSSFVQELPYILHEMRQNGSGDMTLRLNIH